MAVYGRYIIESLFKKKDNNAQTVINACRRVFDEYCNDKSTVKKFNSALTKAKGVIQKEYKNYPDYLKSNLDCIDKMMHGDYQDYMYFSGCVSPFDKSIVTLQFFFYESDEAEYDSVFEPMSKEILEAIKKDTEIQELQDSGIISAIDRSSNKVDIEIHIKK